MIETAANRWERLPPRARLVVGVALRLTLLVLVACSTTAR